LATFILYPKTISQVIIIEITYIAHTDIVIKLCGT